MQSLSTLSRRSFLRDVTAAVGAASTFGLGALNADAGSSPSGIPLRVLGRTGQKITILGLGSAPVGLSKPGLAPGVAVYRAALEAGVNYVDTAHNYDMAEPYLGEALQGWRDKIFLATKSLPLADDPRQGAREMQEQFEDSLRRLKTDHVDLLHVHSIGDKPPEYILASGGPLEFARNIKARGLARFIGVTGHNRPARFAQVIDSGEVDVVMVALNFVDYHQYVFEETILPVARKHQCGLLAMKVFGGHSLGPSGYTAAGPSKMPAASLRDAMRYSLGIEGIAAAVIGPYTAEQVLQNSQWARDYHPLNDHERAALREQGKQLVAQWGPRFGPTA